MKHMLQGIGSRLDWHVCKTIADLRYGLFVLVTGADLRELDRVRELFDIIIDFPDSRKALEDLKVCTPLRSASSKCQFVLQECLQRVDQRSGLVQNLRKAFVGPPQAMPSY